MTTAQNRPFVTIAMPALNEEKYIEQAIGSIIPKNDTFDYELLVVDGGSSDRTCEIVREMATENERIRLLHNPRRIQSAAVNIAASISNAKSTYLLRADCHSLYPDDFVEKCILSFGARDASSIVVPMHSAGVSWLQRAIAATQNSWLGNGGAAHRAALRSGFVDHGHHAAFRLRDFLALNGYDEEFAWCEDVDYDVRVIQSGRRIYLEAGLSITYFARRSFSALARQYLNYGRGRTKLLLKHKRMPKIRQTLPSAVSCACLASLVLAVFNLAFLALPLSYLAFCTLWGSNLAVRRREFGCLASGPAAVVMHLSYGVGFFASLTKEAKTALVHYPGREPRISMKKEVR